VTLVGWFFVSLVACAAGAVLAMFTVTTRKGWNAWITMAFLGGVVINLAFIIAFGLKPT
jgi:hypothetical protein